MLLVAFSNFTKYIALKALILLKLPLRNGQMPADVVELLRSLRPISLAAL